MRRRKNSPSRGAGLALAPLMLLPLAAPLAIGYAAWAEQRAEMRDWDIQGPPCPAARRPLDGAAGRSPQVFYYAGARLARRSGAVSCAALEHGGWWRRRTEHVCQFSAPVLLSMTYGQASAVYAPGVGRSATVRIADGRARCVLGGWFKG